MPGPSREQLPGNDRFEDDSGSGATEFKSIEGGRIGEINARVGDLEFKNDFSDPTVTYQKQRETADHEVVTGHSAVREQDIEFVVQALGERPAEITIEGWVTEDQLETFDSLPSTDYVVVLSGRWVGTAVVQSVDSEYDRIWHDEYGWIFSATIELTAVARNRIPENEQVIDRSAGVDAAGGIGVSGIGESSRLSDTPGPKLSETTKDQLEEEYGDEDVIIDDFGVSPP